MERAAFACGTQRVRRFGGWAALLDELVKRHEALGRVDEAITVICRALQVGWAG